MAMEATLGMGAQMGAIMMMNMRVWTGQEGKEL